MRKIIILRLLFTSHCLNLQHWISLINTLLYSWFSRALFCISGVKLPGAPVYLSPLSFNQITFHSLRNYIYSICIRYEFSYVWLGGQKGAKRHEVVCLRPSPVSSIPPWSRLRTFVRTMLIVVRGWIPTPFIHWRQHHLQYNFIPPRTKTKQRVYTCSGTKEQHVYPDVYIPFVIIYLLSGSIYIYCNAETYLDGVIEVCPCNVFKTSLLFIMETFQRVGTVIIIYTKCTVFSVEKYMSNVTKNTVFWLLYIYFSNHKWKRREKYTNCVSCFFMLVTSKGWLKVHRWFQERVN